MAMVTLSSTSNSSLRDASFSSYLSSNEENFVRQLAESSRNLSPILITQKEEQIHLDKKKEDGEIGVFSAEKYFNGGMDENSPRIAKVTDAKQYRYTKDEKIEPPVKIRLPPGTPSVRSESSWNSQNALLQSVLKNSSRKKTQKVQGKGFFAGLRCKCSCSDKDSIDIDESVTGNSFRRSSTKKEPTRAIHTPEVEKQDLELRGENGFSFPTTNSLVGNLPIQLNFQAVEDEKPRNSIEVFGCSPTEKMNNKSSSVLPWDSNIPGVEINEFLTTPPGDNYDDTDSDASSDLFEIESLTGKPNPFLVRQGSDVTSVAGYAPSEASIEWSVVTASAAEYSVMSDSEEVRPETRVSSPTRNGKTKGPGILLGCKSQKAVRVSGEAHKIVNGKLHHNPKIYRTSDSYIAAATRLKSESKLREHALLASRSIPRSHAPRGSHLLYIQ